MKIKLTLDFEESIESALKKEVGSFINYRVRSKSLDARGINRGKRPRFTYEIEVLKSGEQFEPLTESFPQVGPLSERPIIVGTGPAGLFCALRLLDCGVPSILLERGKPAALRMKDIAKFWRYGQLDPESNVCYGEGGAGLFSDGKLITRVKSPYISYVMQRLVDFGAPEETAYLSNPHLGSNRIRGLIIRLTDYLKKGGCEFRYQARVNQLIYSADGKKVEGVMLASGEKLYSPHIVLATGHSAHEMYRHLEHSHVAMKPKDFAVGVRVEHPSALINQLQHGKFYEHQALGTAKYRLSSHNQLTDRGAYSFCMCPGGIVLSSGTDADGIVTNGMSNYNQDYPWSNAAIIVSVKAGRDFCLKPSDSLLDGFRFQREIEIAAFRHSVEFADGKALPAQSLIPFVEQRKAVGSLPKSSTPSGTFNCSFDKIFPQFVQDELRQAFLQYEKLLPGFLSREAVVMAPETRTSSPVTILRDRETLVSTSTDGLYPCGEGAGHAGGITSAAVDGVNVALSILRRAGKLD